MANAVDKLTRSMSRSGCTSGAGGGDALPEPDEKGAAAQKVAVPRKERIFLTPSNVLEQWCTVVVTILGLALYALIIGNAASILAKFDSTRQQHARQIAALHAFLKRKGISPASNLGQRLTQYFELTLQGGKLSRSVVQTCNATC